jgi:glycosyltransferase involved in cell wall biosynthesis
VVGDERRFARETLKLPARSLVLINTGIMAEQFVPATAAQKAAARDKLGIPREGKLLVTTGRNGPQKNYPPLYAALDRFLPAYPGVLFAHAGAGSLQLRERIHPDYRGRCYCFDFMADVRELLWAADGFILTSFYEAPSLSMLEAFSCGLPLLLTDAPGFSRMRVFGWQIDWMPAPKGCVDFATEVFTALKSWNERPAVSLAPQHAFALQNFNTPTQFSKVVRVYERLARKA